MRLTCPANWTESREGLVVPVMGTSVERGEEVRQLVELLRRQVAEGRHDAGADFHRAQDRGAGDRGGDVGELGPGTVVAVLAQLVTGEAAGAGDDLFASLVLRGDRHLDLGRRAAGGAEEGEVCHRD